MLRTLSVAIAGLTLLTSIFAVAQKKHPPPQQPQPAMHAHIIRVEVQLTRVSKKNGVLHWKISNHNDVPVYVYSSFLWGPAFNAEHKVDAGVVDTAPNEDSDAGCPANVEPVLILRISPNDFREGDFKDPGIQSLASETVSMRIAVGPEAERVTNEAYVAAKTCKHSPYNVIFDWATILQSAPVPLPKDS